MEAGGLVFRGYTQQGKKKYALLQLSFFLFLKIFVDIEEEAPKQ